MTSDPKSSLNDFESILQPRVTYISPAETAKLIRNALKKAFPETKFSVRTSTYSGGASIDIKYTSGPALADVEAITDDFEGSGFDGSVDLKYSRHAWLAPDGTVSFASTNGTQGSMGYVSAQDADALKPGSQLVSFGADYVHVSRKATEAEYWETVKRFEDETGWTIRHQENKYDESGVQKCWPLCDYICRPFPDHGGLITSVERYGMSAEKDAPMIEAEKLARETYNANP